MKYGFQLKSTLTNKHIFLIISIVIAFSQNDKINTEKCKICISCDHMKPSICSLSDLSETADRLECLRYAKNFSWPTASTLHLIPFALTEKLFSKLWHSHTGGECSSKFPFITLSMYNTGFSMPNCTCQRYPSRLDSYCRFRSLELFLLNVFIQFL